MTDNEQFLSNHLLQELPERLHGVSLSLAEAIHFDQELISRSHYAARYRPRELELLQKRFSSFIEDEDDRLLAATVVLEYVEAEGAKLVAKMLDERERCWRAEQARKTKA